MKTVKILSTAILVIASFRPALAANTAGRTYTFGFEFGNLIRNWSFEQNQDNWFDESWSGTQVVSSRLLAKSVSLSAVSGTYIARFTGTNSTTGTLLALKSDIFPIEGNSIYTISFFYRSVSNTSGVLPVLEFYRGNGVDPVVPSVTGTTYFVNSGSWVPYSFSFTAPDKSNFARLSMVQASASQGGTFYFDDVIIEKGNLATARDRVTERLDFVGDAGQVLQSQVKVAGGGQVAASRSYLVSASEYDVHQYPFRAYSSYLNSGNPDYDKDYRSKSLTYNNNPNGKGPLGLAPYSQTSFADEHVARLINSSQPGTAWKDRYLTNGSAFVNSKTPPANPENPFLDYYDGAYLYSWEKDVEGRYTLAWTNEEGQLVRQASQLGTGWIATDYEYYPNGNLKKILVPEEQGGGSPQNFREVTNYNSAGEVTSTYTRDRGLQKYFRNSLGQIRYSQSDVNDAYKYSYTDYDLQDRPISMGEQTLPFGMGAMYTERRSVTEGTKTEHSGIIYDNLSTFQSRTGFTVSSILPGISVGANGEGRVVCLYMLNNEVGYTQFTPVQKFVASFYNYNKYGEVTSTYKYIGPIATASQKIHRTVYTYDEAHRLKTQSLYVDGVAVAESERRITYDALGRVSRTNGIGGRFISSYSYYDWGGLKSIILGGDGGASQGTRIDYNYHAHGWLKEIKATSQNTNKLVFQQFLGYETKSYEHAKIPAPLQSRFDGKVAQQLYKYSTDVLTSGSGWPIKMANYEYDSQGRMKTADLQENTNSAALNALEQIDFNALSWVDTKDKDSRIEYDAIGRITKNQTGGNPEEAAIYNYKNGSYQVDNVNGSVGSDSPRDASAPGNFFYDTQGRLRADASKNLTIHYGWNDLPTDFTVKNYDQTQTTEYQFYDATGKRVARTRVEYSAFNSPSTGIIFIGNQESGEPDNLYNVGPRIGGEFGRWNYLCYGGCNPTNNEFVFYYVVNRGMTSSLEMGETELNAAPIQRSNGPPVPVRVIGVIKDSPFYTSLVRQYVSGKIKSTVAEVNLIGSGDRRWIEEYDDAGALLPGMGIAGVFGLSNSTIGRRNSTGGYEFFLKNHQGSVMRTVNDNGDFATGSNWSSDYLAYGLPKTLKAGTEEVAPGYTGKEFDKDFTGLTYFGARFFDPNFGLWLSPDPAGQFHNPYSFGGDPTNLVDGDGREAATLIFCAIMAYMAASTAQNYTENGKTEWNPLDWRWDDPKTYAALVIGAVSGYAGGAIAGAGFTGSLTTGLAVSSTFYSFGMATLSDSYTPITTDIGFGKIQWNGEDHFTMKNPFDSDPWYENIGEGLGYVSNFSDALAFGDKYFWGGKEEGKVVYEPGTEGEGVYADLKSGYKHQAGKGHSSHLKLIYENNYDGDTWEQSVSWGGGKNNFNDLEIKPEYKTFKATGLNSEKIHDYAEKIRNYDWNGNNCGQNVAASIWGGSTSSYFLTPSANYRLLFMRQMWRNIYGI